MESIIKLDVHDRKLVYKALAMPYLIKAYGLTTTKDITVK